MKYFAALGIALLVIAAASVGPWAPSPFTSQTGTNTTAAAWRTALGAAASSTLSGYVTNHTGAATNLALTGGSVTTQTNTDLTASRVVVSSASKVLASSSVTSTTLGYLDATSSVQTQLDSKPTVALTNVAQLNQSQTWTGTPTFPVGVFTANSIGLRVLYSAPTNLYFTSLSTAANPTNAGDFVLLTSLLEATLPALLSSNSSIYLTLTREHPAQSAGGADIYFYAGTNTNYVGASAGALGGTSQTKGNVTINSPILVNASSFTEQFPGSLLLTAPVIYGSSNFCDTSAPFKIYLGIRTTTSFTNLLVYRLRIVEIP